MRRPRTALSTLGQVVFALALASCGSGASHDCLALPCPLAFALRVTVTDASTGSRVHAATLTVSGAESATVACDSQCFLPGPPGTYLLEVSAPGFQSQRLTVTVHGTQPACGCPTVEVQDVAIVLTPTT